MQKEIYHAVLAYIAEPGDASDVGGKQYARQTAERQSGIDHRHEGMAREGIGPHGILPGQEHIAHCGSHHKDCRKEEHAPVAELLHSPMPHVTKVKEEETHEDIVDTHV